VWCSIAYRQVHIADEFSRVIYEKSVAYTRKFKTFYVSTQEDRKRLHDLIDSKGLSGRIDVTDLSGHIAEQLRERDYSALNSTLRAHGISGTLDEKIVADPLIKYALRKTEKTDQIGIGTAACDAFRALGAVKSQNIKTVYVPEIGRTQGSKAQKFSFVNSRFGCSCP
jgi:hypothetical protein